MSNDVRLPKNFDWQYYVSVNPDLKHMEGNKTAAVEHWLKYGHKENRQYSTYELQLPYKKMLVDISNLLDDLPDDFDPSIYRMLNPDLKSMDDKQACMHFLKHGQKEARHYTVPFPVGNILLINHDISLTGAPIYLYDLYDYLCNNDYDNIYIVEAFPNSVLPTHAKKLYHYNDVNTLRKIFLITQPKLIYSNSINLHSTNLNHFSSWATQTIIHLHETYQDSTKLLKHIDLINSFKIPMYLVSKKIKNEFADNHPTLENLEICPPFISNKKQKTIELNANEPCNLIAGNSQKPLIGMCGNLILRKNPTLLIKLASENPQYNFVWIGGEDLSLIDVNIPSNFFWIKQTDNPYKYMNQLDYFMLTSLSDPCPIVVLEALFLNKKIIVVEDNIHTEHDLNQLESYIVLKSKDMDDICNEFKGLSLDKTKNKTNRNKKYITNHYSKPRIVERI